MTATTAVTADQLVEMLETLCKFNRPSRLRALAAPDLRHYSCGIGDGVSSSSMYHFFPGGRRCLLSAY